MQQKVGGQATPLTLENSYALTSPTEWLTRLRAIVSTPSLLVVCLVALIYAPTFYSPHLMDDTDTVQAQIPLNMLHSGDWVTARLDRVAFLKKSPMLYWMMAGSYTLFDEYDWAARVPIVLSSLLLSWLVFRMGQWAFGYKTGLNSAVIVSTCVGLFLFPRILIPDVAVTGVIAFSLWAMLRALDKDEPRPRQWAHVMAMMPVRSSSGNYLFIKHPFDKDSGEAGNL